ncbi:hypothetical protein DSO57_1015017 [Entomophthora muscae]|uniref:Uncharacterized protein n=1 Tax=Entomophthora muscae TaxID=34485 RepID=A0ACC2S7P8_9FUNG|nr:hypothetical protein DSO57_1015017 [Entomophthora muscae]
MIKPFPLKDPFSLFNRRANPSSIPIITWVTANGVLQKFLQEQGPPNDEKFHASKKEINVPHPSPANDESTMLDDTEDFQALVCVRNIPDTYSCVTNKLSPAVNVKAPTTTVQTSTVTE